ncbi:hypothetical protein ACT8ZV_20410 [Nocardioides sp. MAHUQ-72]|uniref:hypothetical protein n=1 Tax=unclassified Nocardioides TaxID=2615069 RepID=UPI00360F51BB
MTERLSTLLHEEASSLEVPTPAAGAVLARGRTLRRRRRGAVVVAAAAALAVLGSGATLATDAFRHDDRAVEPAGTTSDFASTGAFAIGSDLHIGGRVVDLGEPVKAVYYTSAGAVVRSGDRAATDAAGDSHYTLVTPDGARSAIDVTTGDRIVGLEPDSTHLAYAAAHGDRWDVVVHDVVSDTELARVTVDGTFTWGGWEAPPVVLDGDTVWVHFDGRWTEVDWRTGRAHEVPGTDGVFEAADGSYATRDAGDAWTVHAMADGRVTGTVPLRRGWYAFFSPDGRYLHAFDNEGMGDDGPAAVVYDARTGRERDVAGPLDDLGWTPDGHTMEVRGHTLSTCTPVGGDCTAYTVEGGGQLKLGGNPYGS